MSGLWIFETVFGIVWALVVVVGGHWVFFGGILQVHQVQKPASVACCGVLCVLVSERVFILA